MTEDEYEDHLQKITAKRDKAGVKYERLLVKSEAARQRWLRCCIRVASAGGDVPRSLGLLDRDRDYSIRGDAPDSQEDSIHYAGLYSLIARSLGVDRSSVCRVASGERRSPRIEAALAAEKQRLDAIVVARAAKADSDSEMERGA